MLTAYSAVNKDCSTEKSLKHVKRSVKQQEQVWGEEVCEGLVHLGSWRKSVRGKQRDEIKCPGVSLLKVHLQPAVLKPYKQQSAVRQLGKG